MARHSSFEGFLYDLLDLQDSTSFCDSLQPLAPPVLSASANCSEFHVGILKQGYKQALFSFIKFYT
jgi:hypothetical protein